MTSGVNIPQTANDLDTDSIAFECEQIAEMAEALLNEHSFSLIAVEAKAVAALRLIASTNRNMARMLSSGKASS